MGFGFFRGKKYETEITEMRVLDDGKQHMGNSGEGSFWHHRCSIHPSVTHINLWGPVCFYWKNLASGTSGTK